MEKSVHEIRNGLQNLHFPRWDELPSFPLYMDQVLLFLNQVLDPVHFDAEKPILTSSMVNNYVKNSIVKAPVMKQYRTYHMAYLLVVCVMKRCYSLSEISTLIEIYSDISDQSRTAMDYNKFVTVFEDTISDVFATGTCKKEYFENPTPQQLLMVNVIRTLAYKIFGEYELLEYRQSAVHPEQNCSENVPE